jgi:hypothetical protein
LKQKEDIDMSNNALTVTTNVLAALAFCFLVFSVQECEEQRDLNYNEANKAVAAQRPAVIKACAESCGNKMHRSDPCECK